MTDSFSSSKFTGGNHYEVILYDDFIKVNFEFMKKFGHYCDIVQMNKLKQLLENESSENNNEQHCAIDETDLMPEGICKEMFDKDDDLSPSELETVNMFYNQFGLDAIGPVIYKNCGLVMALTIVKKNLIAICLYVYILIY